MFPMIAGYDDEEKEAALYWIDYLGTLQKLEKGAHGYAAYFCCSILDNHYKKVNLILKVQDMTEAEGLKCLEQCIVELKTRFLIKQTSFEAKIVTKDGIRTVKL